MSIDALDLPDGPSATIAAGTRPGRSRPRADRRQQLIDATIRSIADFGLTGTTIAKVSLIAGTSIGLANFHFDTKERLLEATLRHLADKQRVFWSGRFLDQGLGLTDRLVALVESRFDAQVCDPDTLAVWFAFWGDASARVIYRRVVAHADDERLYAAEAILAGLYAKTGQTDTDTMEMALAVEAYFDGLWLNMLLYPDDFGRLDCQKRALDFVAALFPGEVLRPAGPAA